MLTVKQVITELKPGDPETCEHLFMYSKANLNIGEKKRTQERICTKCGRYELITSSLEVKKFGFSEVFAHFHEE